MDRFDYMEFQQQGGAVTPDSAQVMPQDGASAYRLASKMRRRGHFKRACDMYSLAVGFEPHHYAAWSEWIDTLVRAGHVEAADHKSHEALDKFRQVRLLYAVRALALIHTHRLPEADQLLSVALDGKPTWYGKCVQAELLLYQSKENRHRVIDLLEEATDLTPEKWEPMFLGGLMLYEAGWPALAAGLLAEAVHYDPQSTAALIYLGDCFNALKLHERALFYYQKATELEPNHAIALERLRSNVSKPFGLLRVFQRDHLRQRWDREFEKMMDGYKPE